MFQITTPGHASKCIPLPADIAVLIGRGDSCGVQLKDPSASRVHCRVIAHDGRVTLYDAGSRWGTFVNGQRVTECDLRPGDRIKIGETTLQLTMDSDANHTTLARPSELLRPTGMTSGDNASIKVPAVIGTCQQNSFRAGESICGNRLPAAMPLAINRQLCAEQFVGTSFHRYRIIRLLAETSSGAVFQASSLDDDSLLAMKIFKPSTFATDNAEQRFHRAMKTMLGRRHRHIVELVDAGNWNEWFFTASQFVEGISASALIEKIGIVGMMPTDRVLQIAVDLCESLRFAEDMGIVHRNIRPSNILIRESDGTALLNDLILARSIEVADSERLTNAGEILGDLSYMSPEQLGSGYPFDHRSDIYQLGATLYALLTGHPPLEGSSPAATITQILTAIPGSIRAKNLSTPKALESVIMKMLARNPRDRYLSATNLASALELVLNETQQHHVRAVDVDPCATGWKGADTMS